MTDQRFSNVAEAERLFALQHAPGNLQRLKDSTVKDRLERIRRIERYLLDEHRMREWTEALRLDLGRSPEESKVIELLPVLVAFRHVYVNLREWVKDQPAPVPLAMAGLKAWTRCEPKGHVLIIAPWNYPLQLAVLPLMHAIAAGNAVIVKPSEVSAHASAFIKRMIADLFDEADVAVVEGDVPTTTALLAKPFHHIYFTGSPAVGKVVMRAAAEHLASVTLELGGKSPVVVHKGFDVRKAARIIAWGKCMNTGQTCIAPDFALVHADQIDSFIAACAQEITRMYDPAGKGLESSSDYGRMVDARNYQRVKGLIDDAVAKGARLAIGGGLREGDRFMAPHVLTGVTPEMAVMQEEVFGPVLPVIAYSGLEEALAVIAKLERPLSFYILSNDKRATEAIMRSTTAGTTAINELMATSSNPWQPFGGVNHSGLGKSGGRYSFRAFSNERSVQKRVWGTLAPLKPPFKPFFIRWAMRLARL